MIWLVCVEESVVQHSFLHQISTRLGSLTSGIKISLTPCKVGSGEAGNMFLDSGLLQNTLLVPFTNFFCRSRMTEAAVEAAPPLGSNAARSHVCGAERTFILPEDICPVRGHSSSATVCRALCSLPSLCPAEMQRWRLEMTLVWKAAWPERSQLLLWWINVRCFD